MGQVTQIPPILDLEANPQLVSEVADLLKAMASESRLKMLCLLSESELSVTALAEKTEQTASSVSQHLSKLKSVGLVESRRVAQTIYYCARDGIGMDLMDVLCRHFRPDAH
ncbi:metalloregulator ArsR/SmtB family transcription factor [Henriciella sp. AS95]|uniref:ArsR/SmtB family transcription factor n=1 Tax=Henriciella sp. AS95 TaxID=3135782 RepID=UPI00317F7D66